jgi:hypothetical protein
LWPETVAISLFTGIAWICRKGAIAAPMLSDGADALLDQLRRLLDAQEPPLRRGSRIALTVSDTVANIVALHWQPQLQRASEVDAYARACFELAGIALDDGWTMHAEFRDRDAMGLAYALPNAWLDALLAELARRQLVLTNVLPLSAALYFGSRPRKGGWPAVLIAHEQGRKIACVYGTAGLIGYDVEAIIGSAEHSAQRLAGLLAARFGDTPRQAAWIACAPASGTPRLLGAQPWKESP